MNTVGSENSDEEHAVISTNSPAAGPFEAEDGFTDVVLLVDNKPLHINRSLLAYASPVFNCMFTSEFKEKHERVIELPSKTYDSIVELLSFLHPGVNFVLTTESAFRLLPLADEYQIEVLKEKCEDVLVKELKPPPLPQIAFLMKCLETAEKCGLDDLLAKCIQLMADPSIPIYNVKESGKISLIVKSQIYERRIIRLETERSEAEFWRQKVESVKKRLNDIITPHNEHCRCRTEIKLRSTLQRCCPYCNRTWCSDNISTDSYRGSYWFFCNHKIGFHVSHDTVIRGFLESKDL